MNVAERIYYNGYWINIYYNDNAESPQEWGDGSLFLVHYHRQFWVDEKTFVTKEEIQDWYNNKGDLEERYWIWPVSAYIHGGVALSMGSGRHFPDYDWDVSHVGAVLASKKEFDNEEDAHKACESLIEVWNLYLSGEVYGYYITDSEDEDVGYGCSGYYGDYESSGLLNNAKSEIDNEIEERCKISILEHEECMRILSSVQPTVVY